jgi:hypothetical protein
MKALSFKILAVMLISVSAFAQTYPVTTPTYVPNAIVAPVTYTTSGVTAAVQLNSTTSLDLGITGTYTGLVAQVQVSTQRAASPTDWQTIPVDSLDGDRYASITGNEIFRINAAGYAQARLNIISLSTGSVTVNWSGGLGAGVVGSYNVNKHTYHASVTGLVPAASATDFFTITGSNTQTVRVTHIECSGQATSTGSKLVQLQTRITPNTGGTTVVQSGVASDLTDPIPTAIVNSYTANPTLGTAASGVLRAAILNLPSSAAVGTPPLAWDFGAQTRTTSKEITLRGASQVMAVHGAGASFPSGTVLDCSLEWVEE